MAERNPAAAAAPPQEESLYEEMLRYQNENNIEDEKDILGSKSRRKKKASRSKSPPRAPEGGTPGSTGGRKPAGRSTPTSGRRKKNTSSPARSPTSSSDNRKKPGIVSVDQPAIHPNSAMYHAAYHNPAPTPAPTPSNSNNAFVVEASAVHLRGSDPVDASPNLRSRSPARPTSKKPAGVIDALCVSAQNPPPRAAIVSPMDPLSGSQHNPMFFASVDDTLGTSQHSTKKATPRSRSPMLDLGLSSQHSKKTRGKSPRFKSVDSTSLDLDAASTSKKSKARSKSPKLAGGRMRRKSVSDGAPKINPPRRWGSTDEMPVLTPQEEMTIPTPNMPVFLDASRRQRSIEPSSDPFQQTKNKPTPAKSPPRSDRSPPRSSPDHRKGAKRAPSPKPTKPGIVGRAATSDSEQTSSPRNNVSPTSSAHSRSTHSRSTHNSRPDQVGRAMSDQTAQRARQTRQTRRTSTSQEIMDADMLLALELSKQDAQGSTASPPAAVAQKPPPVARAPSPKPPPPEARAASPKPSPQKARAPSPKPSPSAAAKPAAAAKKSQPVGLGDHFAKSSFAKDATKKAVTDDESSLADVLLALKISAEEEAARRNRVGGPRPPLTGQKSTSIRELLTLEANDKKRRNNRGNNTSAAAAGDEEEDDSSSVMDLVAAGISADGGSSSNDAVKQRRMLDRIREEEEQRQLEMALKASEETAPPPAATTSTAAPLNAATTATGVIDPLPQQQQQEGGDDQVDADLKMALAVSRDEARSASGDLANFEASTDGDFVLQQQRAMEQFAAQKNQPAGGAASAKPPPLDHERGRNSLVQRGTAETHVAISNGKAHIVTCVGCQANLQAPIAYSLVFCPNCQTVSPTGM
mmetsp:Transcript_15410/g.37949  ORF Transcript_15410/g.37949 Transcript_15410/m.37949 type:complete len:861 (+) Transcript_15410:346-2928(+)